MKRVYQMAVAGLMAVTLAASAVFGNAHLVQAEESTKIVLHNDSLTAATEAGGTAYGDMVEAIYKDAYITETSDQRTLTLEFQDGTFTMHNMTFDVYALQTKVAGASGAMGDTELASSAEGLIALYTSDTEYIEPVDVQTGEEQTKTISVFDRSTYTTTESTVSFCPITSVTFDITGLDIGTEFNVALYCEVFNSAMSAGMQFSNYVNPTSGVDYSASFSYEELYMTSDAVAGSTPYGQMLDAIFDSAYITEENDSAYLTINLKSGTFTMYGMTFDVYALVDKASTSTQGDSDLASSETGIFRLYTSQDGASTDSYIEPISIETQTEGITTTISSFDRTTMTTSSADVTFYPVTSITYDVTGMSDWENYYMAFYAEMISSSAAAGMQFSNYINPSSGVDYKAYLRYPSYGSEEETVDSTEDTSDSDTGGTAEDPAQNAQEASVEDLIEEIVEETSDTTDSTTESSTTSTESTSTSSTQDTGNAAVTTAVVSAGQEIAGATVTAGSYEIVIPTTINVSADSNTGAFQIASQTVDLGENVGTIQITVPGSGNISSEQGSATYTNNLSGDFVSAAGDIIDGTIAVSDRISSDDYYVTVDFSIGYVAE